MAVPSEDLITQLVERQVSARVQPERHADARRLLQEAERGPVVVEGYPTFAPHLLGRDHDGFSRSEMEFMRRTQDNGFLWIARSRAIEWLVRHHFADARRVLDIGCGTGYTTRALRRALPGASLYATDVYLEGIRLTAQTLRDDAFVLHLDIADLPFRECFDLITSFDVLEHIADDQLVLDQTFRVLRPGGGALHFVPQHPFLFGPSDRQAHHVRRYGVDELQRRLKKSGFQVVWTTSFMFFLFPAFVASRLKAKLFGSYDVEKEHAPPRTLDSLFRHVQTFELARMRAGWRFPVGVSRLVVARKPL